MAIAEPTASTDLKLSSSKPVSAREARAKVSSNHMTVADQELFASTREKQKRAMPKRELVLALASICAMAVSTVLLWMAAPPTHIRLVAVLCAAVVLSVAALVRFETPLGYSSAAQLGLVPFMLVAPPVLIAPGVCVALVLASLPLALSGEVSPSRLLRIPENVWFCVGPSWALALLHPGAPTVAVLAVVLSAQFSTDFVWAAVSLEATGSSWRQHLRDTWAYVTDLAMSTVGYAVAVVAVHNPCAPLLLLPLLGLLSFFAQDRKRRFAHLTELNETYRGTAMLLGDVIGADDEYTGVHSQDVVRLANAVALELGLDADQRRNVEFAALLHDVGKIVVPKEIINKPGALTDDEWAIMKTHCAEGEKMLSRIGGFMAEVGKIVRSHHERFDGHGYPDGLVGEQAPIESRIITACDSWNAMRTNRSYREALPLEQAIFEIERNVSSQFDPVVAAALLRVVATDADKPAPARMPAVR